MYTVKYIYGRLEIAGRLETGIGMDGLTTIAMSMRGERSLKIF